MLNKKICGYLDCHVVETQVFHLSRYCDNDSSLLKQTSTIWLRRYKRYSLGVKPLMAVDAEKILLLAKQFNDNGGVLKFDKIDERDVLELLELQVQFHWLHDALKSCLEARAVPEGTLRKHLVLIYSSSNIMRTWTEIRYRSTLLQN